MSASISECSCRLVERLICCRREQWSDIALATKLDSNREANYSDSEHGSLDLPRNSGVRLWSTLWTADRLDDRRLTPSLDDASHPVTSAGRSLTLATISFALSFAAWGLVGGLASVFTGLYKLTASQTALLVAVPVLLGSLARLPMGMLTDRFGGRFVFAALLAFSAVAAFLVPLTAQLSMAPRRGLPHRHGRIVVCRRRGLCLAVDPGGSARHRPGNLRAGHDGAVTRRVCRTCRRHAIRLGGGVSGHERVAAAVGGRLFCVRPQSPAGRASCQRRGHDRSAAPRPNGVVTRCASTSSRSAGSSRFPSICRPFCGRSSASRQQMPAFAPLASSSSRRSCGPSVGGWRTGLVARRCCPGCSAA